MTFNIIGLKTLDIFSQKDERGSFQKPFNRKNFENHNISFNIEESYISISNKNCLRGMHYQKEPFAHDKFVACVQGRALDVCVDLRPESETYGKVDSLIIEPGTKSVFIPKGVAHGFYSFQDHTAIVCYTSTVYNPDYDAGVLWNSIDFDWPCKNPLVSERDSSSPSLKEN